MRRWRAILDWWRRVRREPVVPELARGVAALSAVISLGLLFALLTS